MTHGLPIPAEPANPRLHRQVLLGLLAVDLALIAAHLLALAWPARLPPARWSVEADGGVAESFQYLKWALLSLAFAAAAWKQRSVGYLPWALLFAYLLLDDTLQLHERAGGAFAGRVDMPWLHHLRPRDIGELLATCAVAAVLLPPIAAAWRFGGAAVRRASLDMLMLLALLAAFGVVLDAVHSALLQRPALAALLGTLEDGGEMLVASLMLAYGLALWRQAPRPGYADMVSRRLRRGP